MRRFLRSVLPVLLIYSQYPCSFGESGKADIAVVVTGVTDTRGKIMLALVSTKEQYRSGKNIFMTAVLDPEIGSTRHVFENVPPGTYSIKTYHDVNSNGRLDKGIFGIPKEKFGFSNDPVIRRGMPAYADTVFECREGLNEVEIKLNSMALGS